MKLFAKIFNSYSQKSSIVDIKLGTKYAPRLSFHLFLFKVTCFCMNNAYALKFSLIVMSERSLLLPRRILLTTDTAHHCRKNYLLMFCKREDTAQKMKFSIKDFFSKCNQILSFLQIRSHLLKKSYMENFIFCVLRYFE